MVNVTVIYPGPRGEQAIIKLSRVPSKGEMVRLKSTVFEVATVCHIPRVENQNNDAIIKLSEVTL